MAKSIDETVPSSVKGQFGVATRAYLEVGVVLIFFLGAILPDDKEGMRNDNIRWRIIFSIPLWIAVIQSLCWLFVIKQEPVGFNISNDNDEGALALLKRIYRQGKLSDEEFETKIK